MSLRTVLAASLIALLISGCSHHDADPGTSSARSRTTTVEQAGTDTSSCGAYRTGASVRVKIAPGSDTECDALAKQLSADGSFWTVRPQAVEEAQLRLICVMKEGSERAYVEDTGSAIYGRQLCSIFLSQGWDEDTATENQAAQHAAAASASSAAAAAASSAAAASAAQLANDEQSAAQLVTSLQAVPGKLSDYLETMDGHVQQALDDLAQTQNDAAKGQGDGCYNVQTVAYDATNDVGYDATNDVGYDAASNVAYVIKQARDDLTSLEGVTQRIRAANGTVPANAATASNGATTAIAAGIAHANSNIDKANAAATSAYQIAAGLATGDCTGYGSGTFQPVQHIN